MSQLTFNSKNTEIAINFGGQVVDGKIKSVGKLADNKIRCYVVDAEQETSGGMIPVGFVQCLDNVPSRGQGANDAFAGTNALADMFGTNEFTSTNLYRSRELVNKATAKKLSEMLGKPLPGFSLIVTDSFEPVYEGQSNSVNRDGEDKLSEGKPFYTTVQLKPEGTVEHSVFKMDKVEVLNPEIKSEFEANKAF